MELLAKQAGEYVENAAWLAAEKNLLDAANCAMRRRSRLEHPAGSFDRQGRFWPDVSEHRACCDWITEPTKNYPYSQMHHCRSMAHIAELYGVDALDLRRKVRELKKAEKEAA
jgi:hypothetical protein